MNRRAFLRSIFAGAAALAVPASALRLVAPEVFRLYGDGVHDDTAAMQALIDGCRVTGPDGTLCENRGVVYIPAGTYRINSQITW